MLKHALRDSDCELLSYLVERHKLLGQVLQERKRHRDNVARAAEIWGEAP